MGQHLGDVLIRASLVKGGYLYTLPWACRIRCRSLGVLGLWSIVIAFTTLPSFIDIRARESPRFAKYRVSSTISRTQAQEPDASTIRGPRTHELRNKSSARLKPFRIAASTF